MSSFVWCFHLQAWEDTYTKWDQATKQILNFPKNKADDGQVGMFKKGFSPLCVSLSDGNVVGTSILELLEFKWNLDVVSVFEDVTQSGQVGVLLYKT